MEMSISKGMVKFWWLIPWNIMLPLKRMNKRLWFYFRESVNGRNHSRREKQTFPWAGSWMWGSIPGPWVHDLSWRLTMLNWLRHPGALRMEFKPLARRNFHNALLSDKRWREEFITFLLKTTALPYIYLCMIILECGSVEASQNMLTKRNIAMIKLTCLIRSCLCKITQICVFTSSGIIKSLLTVVLFGL